MDNELEVIRDEMEQTRASLADKLGALETQVRETVSDARQAVDSTVEGVKSVVGTVTDTVGTVAEQFNVSKQIQEHPWVVMGLAVAAGFVAGQVVGRLGGPSPAPGAPQPVAPQVPLSASRFGEAAPAERKGVLDSVVPAALSGVANEVMGNVGHLALDSLFGIIRELTVRNLPPEWTGEVNKMVDHVAEQLGGKPIDRARSSQLLGLFGLGEKKEEPARQEPAEGRAQPWQEGAPYDPLKQPVGAVSNGPGVRSGS